MEPSVRRVIIKKYGREISYHEQFIEGGGLRTGDPGPLDTLILELEANIDALKALKKELEEGDD